MLQVARVLRHTCLLFHACCCSQKRPHQASEDCANKNTHTHTVGPSEQIPLGVTCSTDVHGLVVFAVER